MIGSFDGQDIVEAVLETAQTRIAILNYGCVVRNWRHRDVPMVLGFEAFEDYLLHSRSFGIIAGRVANRIAGGRFDLNGQTVTLACNSGPNHLHGGTVGLGRRIWALETGANSVALRYHSPDGEDGYPGAVKFEVVFTLEATTLRCEMSAMPDRLTPINLAQHSYYNLVGRDDVRDHLYRIEADHVLPVDDTLIPTGEIAALDGTRFDFRAPRSMTEADPGRDGYDHNMVLRRDRDTTRPAVEVTGGQRRLRMWTDQPGVQFFSATGLRVSVPGLDGLTYGPFGGFCIEAQGFPDSVNRPNFPTVLSAPESPYFQTLAVDICDV